MQRTWHFPGIPERFKIVVGGFPFNDSGSRSSDSLSMSLDQANEIVVRGSVPEHHPLGQGIRHG